MSMLVRGGMEGRERGEVDGGRGREQLFRKRVEEQI